jgi:hypothetical protein
MSHKLALTALALLAMLGLVGCGTDSGAETASTSQVQPGRGVVINGILHYQGCDGAKHKDSSYVRSTASERILSAGDYFQRKCVTPFQLWTRERSRSTDSGSGGPSSGGVALTGTAAIQAPNAADPFASLRGDYDAFCGEVKALRILLNSRTSDGVSGLNRHPSLARALRLDRPLESAGVAERARVNDLNLAKLNDAMNCPIATRYAQIDNGDEGSIHTQGDQGAPASSGRRSE